MPDPSTIEYTTIYEHDVSVGYRRLPNGEYHIDSADAWFFAEVALKYNFYPGRPAGGHETLGGVPGAGPPIDPPEPPEIVDGEALLVWRRRGTSAVERELPVGWDWALSAAAINEDDLLDFALNEQG